MNDITNLPQLVSLEQLVRIMPEGSGRLPLFVVPLNRAMHEFDITTERRIEAFLPQLAHESGRFLYMRELASGAAYDGRADLGNTDLEAIRIAAQHGTTPGRFWKGHGPIQITGFENHKRCSLALYGDLRLLDNPARLEQPEDGCRAAAWFWKVKGLNELADAGNFDRITRRINGGTNGAADRIALWEVAKEIIT